MDFALSDEQRMLKDSVDRLVAERYDFEARRGHLARAAGFSEECWQAYAELGLLALPFAEDDGGFGAGPVEIALVMEAFGRGLVLEPYLSSVVLTGSLLALHCTPEQRAALLPAMIEGRSRPAFAHLEDQARYDLCDVAARAERLPDGRWRLRGRKVLVLHGDSADLLIVSARTRGERRDTAGISLFAVRADHPDLRRRPYLLQDRTRGADVELADLTLSADALLGEVDAALPAIETAVDRAIVAMCAEAVGAMQEILRLTLDYLKVRKQFGVPIGSFQALQHRAVDMLVAIEQARSMSCFASMSSHPTDRAGRRRAVSAAKYHIARAARFVGQQGVHLHGGIGMTEECQVGHYFRRLSLIEMLFGDAHHHLAQLVALGGLQDASEAESAD